MIVTATFDEVFDLRELFQPFIRLYAVVRGLVARMAEEITDEDKEGLSEEELKALEEDIGEDDEPGSGDLDPSGDKDDDPGGDKDDKKDDNAGNDKGDDDKDTGDKDGDDGTGDDDDKGDKDDKKKPDPAPEPEPKGPPVKAIQLDGPAAEDLESAKAAVEEAKQKLADAEKAVKDAWQQFEDGDIDHAEYEAIRDQVFQAKDAYYEARINYTALETEAKMSQAVTKGSRQAEWQAAQDLFYDNFPEFAENPVLNEMLVSRVNRLIEDPESDAHTMTDMQLLLSVKDGILKDLKSLGIKTGERDGDNEDEKNKEDLKRKAMQKKSEKDKAAAASQKDLTNVPPADAGDDDDEFAWLDRLEGEEYERAVEKLTPEQREKYENR